MKQSLVVLAVALVLAGCSTPPPAKVDAPPPAVAAPAAPAATPSLSPARESRQPPAECLAVLDRLADAVPRDESGPALRARGLRIKSPILMPPDVVLDATRTSAVRVRVIIDKRGFVKPGSLVVQEAVGDPALAIGIAAAAERSLSFDLSAAPNPPQEFAFTTVYLNCARP